MQRSDAINELATALAKAQGLLQSASKDSTNPFFRSNYANLTSVWEACRKPLSDNGLSVIQTLDIKDGTSVLETTLLHSSGQFITSFLSITPKEQTPQAIGSAITYARRYALSALIGIVADEDDDAESAMGRKDAQTKYTKPPQKPLPSKPPMTAPQPSPTTPPKDDLLFPENSPEPSKEAPKQFGNTKPPLIEPTKADKVETRKLPVSGASSFVPKSETDLVGGARHYFGKDIPAIREVLKTGVPTTVEEIKTAWLTLCKAWSTI